MPKVHPNPGSNYGSGGAGHMRMNIGSCRKTLGASAHEYRGGGEENIKDRTMSAWVACTAGVALH